jgi:hypothetical protein
MPGLELASVFGWGLIAATFGYASMEHRGVGAATVTAALAALITKAVVFDFI